MVVIISAGVVNIIGAAVLLGGDNWYGCGWYNSNGRGGYYECGCGGYNMGGGPSTWPRTYFKVAPIAVAKKKSRQLTNKVGI